MDSQCAYLLVMALDPFSEPQKGGGASSEGHIHIRIQQRNGRKTLTTVQGIAEDYDKKKIVKVCKKVRGQAVIKLSLTCNGTWPIECPQVLPAAVTTCDAP